jgi:hypothetical protein
MWQIGSCRFMCCPPSEQPILQLQQVYTDCTSISQTCKSAYARFFMCETSFQDSPNSREFEMVDSRGESWRSWFGGGPCTVCILHCCPLYVVSAVFPRSFALPGRLQPAPHSASLASARTVLLTHSETWLHPSQSPYGLLLPCPPVLAEQHGGSTSQVIIGQRGEGTGNLVPGQARGAELAWKTQETLKSSETMRSYAPWEREASERSSVSWVGVVKERLKSDE